MVSTLPFGLISAMAPAAGVAVVTFVLVRRARQRPPETSHPRQFSAERLGQERLGGTRPLARGIPRAPQVALVGLGLAAMLGACDINGSVAPRPTATHVTSAVKYTSGPCPFALGAGFRDGQNVRCGFVSVPEDRANPTSHTIKLAVAVFKTPSHTPATDPVLFLQGGPGGRIIQDLAQTIVGGQLDLQGQFGNRDLVLLDQRGTGYSTPSLQCQEVVYLQYQTNANLTPQQQVDAQNQALAACHTRLVGQGIALGAYSTASDAADVHDVIDALGYQQVNLYGVSYGTRVALEVMRAFPQHIRSVVLDSTVAPQLPFLSAIPATTARVFNTLFQGCAADPACNTRYPNLDSVFYGLVTSLNAHPITFQTTDQSGDAKNGQTFTVLFHGDDLVNLTFTAFYATPAIGVLPQMIYQLRNGNTQRAAQLYGILLFDDSLSWGLYFSVECAEDVNTETTSQLEAAAQAYPPALRTDQLISLEGEIPGCQTWSVPTAAASEADPVTTNLPTLIMESEYDPITPPSNGDLVAKTLPASYRFLFPGVGHGAMLFNSCPTSIALAFWSAPGQQPSSSCIATMGEPQFQ